MGGLANSAALGLQAGGTITSAIGQHRAGKAAEKAARFNAEMVRRETDARFAQMVGEARRRRSSNIVRVAKSGVRLSGSPLAVLEVMGPARVLARAGVGGLGWRPSSGS